MTEAIVFVSITILLLVAILYVGKLISALNRSNNQTLRHAIDSNQAMMQKMLDRYSEMTDRAIDTSQRGMTEVSRALSPPIPPDIPVTDRPHVELPPEIVEFADHLDWTDALTGIPRSDVASIRPGEGIPGIGSNATPPEYSAAGEDYDGMG